MAVILTTARALGFLTSATHSNFVCARIHSSYPLDEEDGVRDAALFFELRSLCGRLKLFQI